jgi:DNA repair protein RadC
MVCSYLHVARFLRVSWREVDMDTLLCAVEELGDAALLAELLGVEMSVAGHLMCGRSDLSELGRVEVPELMKVDGVGCRRARRLRLALELGLRAVRVPRVRRLPVCDAQQAWAYLAPRFRGLAVEQLHAMYLDRRRRPVDVRQLSSGSSRFTVVDPMQVLRPAVGLGASAVILAHNHPSGALEPSARDLEVTRRVAAAARVVGVSLLDHLVISDAGYTSIASTSRHSVTGELGWTA